MAYVFKVNLFMSCFKWLQVPKDWLLFVIVLLVVAVDLLIILIGTAISSARLNATLVPDDQHKITIDVSILSPSQTNTGTVLFWCDTHAGWWHHPWKLCVCMLEPQCYYLASHLVCLQGTPAAGSHVHGLPHTQGENQSSQWLKGNCCHYLHQQHHSGSAISCWICSECLPWGVCCSVWSGTAGRGHSLPYTCLHPKGKVTTCSYVLWVVSSTGNVS